MNKYDKYESNRFELVWKYSHALTCEQKIPRKIKKIILGPKLNKAKLRKLLLSVKITTNKYPEPATIEPYEFCPKCGCTMIISTGNMSAYPESYVKNFCARCGYLVALQDNSPWMSCLEFPENNYVIDW